MSTDSTNESLFTNKSNLDDLLQQLAENQIAYRPTAMDKELLDAVFAWAKKCRVVYLQLL